MQLWHDKVSNDKVEVLTFKEFHSLSAIACLLYLVTLAPEDIGDIHSNYAFVFDEQDFRCHPPK